MQICEDVYRTPWSISMCHISRISERIATFLYLYEESFIINILKEGQKVYLSHSMLREHRIDIVDVASSA